MTDVAEQNRVVLALSDKEAQMVFRALVDYRKILKFSAIVDRGVIEPEIQRVDDVSERLTLLSLDAIQPGL